MKKRRKKGRRRMFMFPMYHIPYPVFRFFFPVLFIISFHLSLGFTFGPCARNRFPLTFPMVVVRCDFHVPGPKIWSHARSMAWLRVSDLFVALGMPLFATSHCPFLARQLASHWFRTPSSNIYRSSHLSAVKDIIALSSRACVDLHSRFRTITLQSSPLRRRNCPFHWC